MARLQNHARIERSPLNGSLRTRPTRRLLRSDRFALRSGRAPCRVPDHTPTAGASGVRTRRGGRDRPAGGAAQAEVRARRGAAPGRGRWASVRQAVARAVHRPRACAAVRRGTGRRPPGRPARRGRLLRFLTRDTVRPLLGADPRCGRGHRERSPPLRRPRQAALPGHLGSPLAAQGPRGLPRRAVGRVLDRGAHAQPGRHPARPYRARDRIRQTRVEHRPSAACQGRTGHGVRHRPRTPYAGPLPGLHSCPRPRGRTQRRRACAVRDRRALTARRGLPQAAQRRVRRHRDQQRGRTRTRRPAGRLRAHHNRRARHPIPDDRPLLLPAQRCNAVNFLHGASVGPFIFLVQAEILAASAALARGGLDPGMHEISPTDRATIAATWLDYFNR
jgi:hypothetical protein